MSPLRCACDDGGLVEGGVAGIAKALFLLLLLLFLVVVVVVVVAVAVGREWPETESRDLFLDGSASERPWAGGSDDWRFPI